MMQYIIPIYQYMTYASLLKKNLSKDYLRIISRQRCAKFINVYKRDRHKT